MPAYRSRTSTHRITSYNVCYTKLLRLIRFDLDTGQQGIKVHKTADENVKAAVVCRGA